jgi:hypothetical protein
MANFLHLSNSTIAFGLLSSKTTVTRPLPQQNTALTERVEILLKQNTELTETVRTLVERIDAMTSEVHARMTPPARG